jgi:hypothetical protein
MIYLRRGALDLCSVCDRIDVPLSVAVKFDFEHLTLKEIFLSARSGCKFCSLILVGFDLTGLPLGRSTRHKTTTVTETRKLKSLLGGDSSWLRAKLWLDLPSWSRLEVRCSVRRGDERVDIPMMLYYHLSPSTSSSTFLLDGAYHNDCVLYQGRVYHKILIPRIPSVS